MNTRKIISRILMGAALAIPLAAMPTAQAHAAVVISVGFAPPVLPVYAQPICPNPGYLWTPGYWAYGPDGYYWVPGVWVQPPSAGVLWTPAYWGWSGGVYLFHPG
jgi:WXXGXW repeat (2 copies)